MNNLLPETLLRASEMEVESDLAELQAGIDHLQVKGGVEDLHQELVEVSHVQTMNHNILLHSLCCGTGNWRSNFWDISYIYLSVRCLKVRAFSTRGQCTKHKKYGVHNVIVHIEMPYKHMRHNRQIDICFAGCQSQRARLQPRQ